MEVFGVRVINTVAVAITAGRLHHAVDFLFEKVVAWPDFAHFAPFSDSD